MKKYLLYPLISIFLFSFGNLFKNEAIALQFIFKDVQYSFQAIRAIDKASSGGQILENVSKHSTASRKAMTKGGTESGIKPQRIGKKPQINFLLPAIRSVQSRSTFVHPTITGQLSSFFIPTPKTPE